MEKDLPSQKVKELNEDLTLSLASALDQRSWFQGSYEMTGNESHQAVATNLDRTVNLIKEARENLAESLDKGISIDPPRKGLSMKAKMAALVVTGALTGTAVLMANPAAIRAFPW